MESKSIDTIYPKLDVNTDIEKKDRMIINAIIEVIRRRAEQAKDPDEMPKYYIMDRYRLAAISELSFDQIKTFLRVGNKAGIVKVSNKYNGENGYAIDFKKVKAYNESASSRIFYEDKKTKNRYTRKQLIDDIVNESTARFVRAKNSKLTLF